MRLADEAAAMGYLADIDAFTVGIGDDHLMGPLQPGVLPDRTVSAAIRKSGNGAGPTF
jgi:hypothetical protein